MLAELIPPAGIRLRRDFMILLQLVRAHAVLHQETRQRGEDGQVIATLDDYKVVRELAADLLSAGVEVGVPKTVRETVEAVQELRRWYKLKQQSGTSRLEKVYQDNEEEDARQDDVTVTMVATKLKLDTSSASRRVKQAIAAGYLENAEARKGRPYKLVLGNAMPDNAELLPTVEQVEEAEQGAMNKQQTKED